MQFIRICSCHKYQTKIEVICCFWILHFMYPCILPRYSIYTVPWNYIGCTYIIHPCSSCLLGPACSISVIQPEFYLLNTVSPACNLILAEIHMWDVIFTSHLESLLKKCKSQHSSRGMNQYDKNVYRGRLISSYENLSREPLLRW
jgi:hypothetical protein